MARRVRQYKRRKATTTTAGTLRWREYCEQSRLTSMNGDFRTRNTVEKEKQSKASGSAKSSDLDVNDAERQEKVWASILVFAQAIEEKLNKAASGSKKNLQAPKLSTLCSFLNNAYHVPPLSGYISISSDVPATFDTCMDNIATYVDQARGVQAKLMDLLDEADDEGVDLDSLQKLLDQASRSLAVELDDAEMVQDQVRLGLDWQKRLDVLVADNEHCLQSLEDLAVEGRAFAFRSKGLVCLESRISKAHKLRDKIVDWKKVGFRGPGLIFLHVEHFSMYTLM
jgi:hypothetical protein